MKNLVKQFSLVTLVLLGGQLCAQEVLPRPEEPFAGKIGLTYKDSEAVKPQLKIPATFGLENPPNILIVLIDDCGFGQMGTFGGGIPTPTLDRIANNGLKYTRFHTTALCSPTRAALLTGRNHHSVGSGVIGEAGTGFPGYSGSFRPRQQPSPKSFASMDTPTLGLEKTTTSPIGKPASSDPSIAGPLASALITFTALSVAIPTNSIQRWSKTRNESSRRKRTKTVRPITSRRTSPITPSA